jgi:hypothetical protein
VGILDSRRWSDRVTDFTCATVNVTAFTLLWVFLIGMWAFLGLGAIALFKAAWAAWRHA